LLESSHKEGEEVGREFQSRVIEMWQMGIEGTAHLGAYGKGSSKCGSMECFLCQVCRLIGFYRESKSEAGKFVRRLEEEMEPTNNLAERTNYPLWSFVA